MAVAEKVVHAWREWGIQALVLLSFTLQVTLLILAKFRRHVDSGVLRFFVWSAYMLADSTAIYVLGHMALAGIGSSPERRELMAFWVPFLLVHLGGQDNITAYAIEDNKLWLRHLQTLVVEVAAATYILYQSSSILGGSSSSRGSSALLLRWATVLTFVAGVAKYVERVWALWLAGRLGEAGFNDNYRSMERTVTVAGLYLESLERPIENKEHIVGLAHNLLETSKELLWKQTTSKSWQHMVLTGRTAYTVAELQLSLLHDVLYTKTLVMRSWHGIGIRVASVLATAAALLLFHSSSNRDFLHGVSLFDVTVTYVVSVGAVALEVVSAVRVAFSSWTWAPKLVYWTRPRAQHGLRSKTVLFFRQLFWAAKRRIGSSWSRSMGQHNMLSLCVRSSASWSSRVARWVGLEDWWNVLAHSPPAAPVPELVRAQMERTQVATDSGGASDRSGAVRLKWAGVGGDFSGSTSAAAPAAPVLAPPLATDWKPDHVINVHAREKLTRWGLCEGEGLDWTVEESILVWHVATDLYLLGTAGRWTTAGATTATMPQAAVVQGDGTHQQRWPQAQAHQDVTQGDVLSLRQAVQVLSNYMLFLLAARPNMLPPSTSRDAYVQMCYALKNPRRPDHLYYQLPSLEHTSAEALARSLLCHGKELNTESVQPPQFAPVIPGSRNDSAMAVTAARLGAKLIDEEENSSSSSSSAVCDLLLKVWMDMLIYVSSRCSAESHAEQLSNGGELVTVVALLAKYYTEGIVSSKAGPVEYPVKLTVLPSGGSAHGKKNRRNLQV